MLNPFAALIGAIQHLTGQVRRLGDAFGAMAEQIEQRGELPAPPTLPEPVGRRNGRLPKPVAE